MELLCPDVPFVGLNGTASVAAFVGPDGVSRHFDAKTTQGVL